MHNHSGKNDTHYSSSQKNNLFDNSKPSSSAWIITFADLMALLLAFFILLLSFSNMDLEKYIKISSALQEAFTNSQLTAIPSKTETTVTPPDSANQPPPNVSNKPPTTDKTATAIEAISHQAQHQPLTKLNEQNLPEILKLLQSEIEQGMLEVFIEKSYLVLRFPEQVAFPIGSDGLNTNFFPLLEKVNQILEKSQGKIIVSGHTDDQKIKNTRFRSNWDLSSARAVSVIHNILKMTQIPSQRFIAQGYADTQPIVANDSGKNRLKNRRVEILIANQMSE